MSEPKTYIDLFAGCGGLSLGLHNSGWKGLFAIEKSPDAFETLKFNLIKKKQHFEWPDWLRKSNHDIDEVLLNFESELTSLIGHVDLVAGGPPCQGFSSAGRRVEDDSRNDLINSYIKFIDLVKPKLIFFENVKGFTLGFKNNNEKGLAYSSYVVDQLEKIGYSVKGQLIDFSDFGIPQKRTRYILVGIQENLIQKNNNLNKEIFFNKLFNNKDEFLVSKNLAINPNLEDAISDLLKSNGVIVTFSPSLVPRLG